MTADKFKVLLMEDGDIPASYKVLSESFGHNAPFVDIYFPNHDTPAGQVQGSKRLAAWKQAEESTFLKAVFPNEDNKERIIGLAVWTLMKTAPPAELEKVENVVEVWPDEDDREFMTQLWRDYVVPRTNAIENSGGKGVYVLELLAVHPDAQRIGVGKELVEWGTKAADAQGLKAVVEGTPVSRRVYEKCGLITTIEEMPFNVAEKFTNRRKPTLLFLERSLNSRGQSCVFRRI